MRGAAGWRTCWPPSKNAKLLAPDRLERAAASRDHRSALEVARLTPADVNCGRPGAPVRAGDSSHAARAVSQCPDVDGGASRGACGIGILSIAVRAATVLTLDRDGDFRSAARWRAQATNCTWKKICIIRIRSATSTAASPSCSDSTPARTSTKSSGSPPPIRASSFLPLFEEMLGSRGDWPLHQSQLFRFRSSEPGWLQREVLLAPGSRRWRRDSREAARATRRGIAARHRARGVCAWPARARIYAWPAAWP